MTKSPYTGVGLGVGVMLGAGRGIQPAMARLFSSAKSRRVMVSMGRSTSLNSCCKVQTGCLAGVSVGVGDRVADGVCVGNVVGMGNGVRMGDNVTVGGGVSVCVWATGTGYW